MIRNPIKVGTVSASANGVEHLSIPVGHNGTISQFLFMCYKGDVLARTVDSIKAITLEATSDLEGNFAILNNVTPEFLEYREGHTRGMIIPDQTAG